MADWRFRRDNWICVWVSEYRACLGCLFSFGYWVNVFVCNDPKLFSTQHLNQLKSFLSYAGINLFIQSVSQSHRNIYYSIAPSPLLYLPYIPSRIAATLLIDNSQTRSRRKQNIPVPLTN